MRLEGGRVICTPSGFSKGFLSAPDLVVVDLKDGSVISSRPGIKVSSEIDLHLSIYREHKEVAAVIHSHPPHAGAFALAGRPVPWGIYPEAEIFLGRVGWVDYVTPGSPQLGHAAAAALNANCDAAILDHHGVVTVGGSLLEAYDRLEILDSYCKILLLSEKLGGATKLNTQACEKLGRLRQKFTGK